MKIDIRTNKKEGETTLFTRMRIGGKSEHINLQLKVDIKQWIDVRDSDRKRENYLDRMGYTKFIMDIEFGIKQLKRDGKETMEHVDTLIRDIVLKEQREKLLKNEELRKKVKERETKSVKTYMTNFIRQIESGEVRTKKENYTADNPSRCGNSCQEFFLISTLITRLLGRRLTKILSTNFSLTLKRTGI